MTIEQKIAEVLNENTEPDVTTVENTDIKVDVSEDVAALFNGEDQLSEEFKTKAATIFEAAVVTRVKAELAKIEESFDARVATEVEVIKEGLSEKVDGHLDYIVEQWLSDNKVALTNGIKLEIYENFIEGMKKVFVENYVDVPEEKFDVVGSLEEKVAELTEKLNSVTESNVELHGKLKSINKAKSIDEASEGLTDVQIDKFKTLAEELTFEDDESFKVKLKTIRENYFSAKTTEEIDTTPVVVTDTPITEEVAKPTSYIDPSVSRYLTAFDNN